MRQADGSQSDVCTIVIQLNARADLHIRTTPVHALDVLSGQTLFDPETASVIDMSGNALTISDLQKLTR